MYVFIGQCDVKHIMTIRSVLNVMTNMTTYITVRSIGLAVILGTMPSSTIHNCEYSIYIVCMCRICSTQTCPNMHSWTNLILYKKTTLILPKNSMKGIDNILVMFGGRIFQQTVGNPIGTNCAPLIANLFLYSYEADFRYRGFSRKTKRS